ncbi:MAG: sensor histidine kinase, partial [Verrucomicrobiota bacterium]
LPDSAPKDIGFTPGILFGACEVYVNEVLIGRHGQIDLGYCEPFNPTPHFRVPNDVLRSGRNVLAIRCSYGGMVGGKPRLADLDVIEAAKLRLHAVSWLLSGGALAVLTVFSALGLVLIVKGERDPANLWFLISQITLATMAALFMVESPTAFTWAWIVGASLHTPSFFVLCSKLLGFPISRWLWLVLSPLILVPPIGLIDPNLWNVFQPTFLRVAALTSTLVAFGLGGLYLVIQCIAALRRGIPAAAPTTGGIAVIALYGILGEGGLLFRFGISDTWIQFYGPAATILFVLAVSLAMLRHYAEARLRASELSEKVLSAQEDERKRLSRELHDGVAQSLQAVKLKAQLLQHRSEKAHSSQAAGEIAHDIGTTIDELRMAARDLRPEFLEDVPLPAAFKWYADHFESQIVVTIECVGQLPGFSARTKDNLYRVFQEALINSLRHGEATRIETRIESDQQGVILSMTDNGRGDQKDPSDQRGMGLASMAERIGILGGEFSASDRTDGPGFQVIAKLPRRELEIG